MTKKAIEDTGLTMQEGPKLELISYTGHNCLFLGLCKDIKIAIRELKIRYPIFVVK